MGRGKVTEGSDRGRFLDVLRRTVEALDRWDRPYAIFGTVGTNVYLNGGPAEDIDVFVAKADAAGAIEALLASGFVAGDRDESWIYKAYRDDVLIDVIFGIRDRLAFDDRMAAAVRRARYHGVDVPVPAPEDLVLIAACSAHVGTPEHWFTGMRLVSDVEIDWERLAEDARGPAQLRVASLLLYCRSEGIEVPEGILTSLLPS